MKFNNPEVVESICTQMRMAEFNRGKNRALINNLFNGAPPYTAAEEEENEIQVNINDLAGCRLSHEARSQFYQSILKPGNFFKSRTDTGPVHKRAQWDSIVTKERNKIMKKSMLYIESQRSKIAMNVLHGIAPCGWRDEYRWCPYAMGIEDVFVPGNTLLTMENLPFFAIYRTMTAPEFVKLYNSGRIDPAWNKPMLKGAIQWVDKQSQTLMYNNWPEVWSPEKTMERVKGDGGYYYGDQVPTINVFDFYFWNDSGKMAGWNRRMILDAWSMPENMVEGQSTPTPTRKQGKLYENYRRQFLYNPGDRKVATDTHEFINWQFADLSAVAPFKYHSVRSLGFLLYSVCHLQNRLRCKFNESVFEQLMIYFRVNTELDSQRSLKVDLVNRGFIDDSVKFIPPQERYQVNAQLAQLGLAQNDQLITQNSSSYRQQQNYSQDRVEKTKFQVMNEVNSTSSLVGAALGQAYMYQQFEYEEIARRFAIRNSPDPQVRTFQANCLRQGVSEKVLYNPACWDHEADRTFGAGNKTMELAIAQQLMEWRNLYDPEPQRDILRNVTLALTDDAALSNSLVPEHPVKISDSIHDAQLSAGALLAGLPVAMKTGINHIEYVDAMMHTLLALVQQAQQQLPTPDRLSGMFNIMNNIGQHVGVIAQDMNEKQRVTQYGSELSQIGNALKAMAQQVGEQQQAKAQNGSQPDPELQAKIQAMLQQANVKAENTRTAHAQRTAQRQISFELDEKRKNQMTAAEIERENLRAANQLGSDLTIDRETANSDIVLEHKKLAMKPKVDKKKARD